MVLMAVLLGMYQKQSMNNKLHLMKKLFNLKMPKVTHVSKHLNKFKSITNQFVFDLY